MPRMCMTRAHAAKSSNDRAASKVEIAERVEQLVANELVGIAQTARVQHMVTADHNDAIERPTTTKARCPQTVYFVEKTKSTRPAELRFERRCIKHDTNILSANQRVGEADLEAHREAVIGQQGGRRTLLDNSHRFEHFYRAARCILLD